MASTAKLSIPLVYRVLMLYLDPLLAFNGAILLHFQPIRFLKTMSPTAIYSPSNQVIFDQLAASYVVFAFNEGIVLRVTNDLRTWKAVILGALISDLLHIYSSWLALGAETMMNPLLWRMDDFVNIGLLAGPAMIRTSFLLGVGLSDAEKEKEW